MTDNKEVILQSRIEQLEAEKAELIEMLKNTLCEICHDCTDEYAQECNWYYECGKGCDAVKKQSELLKKHGVEI